METGFLANREKQSAMIRRIEIIGEAITHADRCNPSKRFLLSYTPSFPGVGGESPESSSGRQPRNKGAVRLSCDYGGTFGDTFC